MTPSVGAMSEMKETALAKPMGQHKLNTACTMFPCPGLIVWNVLSRCQTQGSFLSTASCSEPLVSYARENSGEHTS